MNRNKNMLNVLMVTARYFPDIGGIETHVHEVGRRLASNGINITLLTTMPHALSTPLPREMVVEGMRVIRVRSWPSERDYPIAHICSTNSDACGQKSRDPIRGYVS
ncbi:MAG: glycosyltransferase family 4 protein [Chloroflexi bacterium]|nr:MAG: glycosyltransferase family 4 protein [Chloroflexota bacterium]